MTERLGAADVCALLEKLRESAPLVQCLTNTVVTNFTANVLLAIGAAPAMTDIPNEAGMFAEIASATLINVGTPHAEQRIAMIEAARAAHRAGHPWVLDPVAVGALPVRTALARELLEYSPTAIRGNASEIMALAGLGTGGRGVDTVHSAERALEAATHLARACGSTVAISGATDLVTDGTDVLRISNGHHYLTLVTGGGCALGAVTAAFLAVGEDRLAATAAATAVYTIAAELAAVNARGPGTFAVAFIDALAAVDGAQIQSRVTIA
ncbi:hydroxyethylthiazole kinase [Cryobacterium sp. PH31-AA6]|uniref:hydroxyethylthiazole kinase n=1 Tax=Cryobacterium sp. PH31-AA6 TaxID=3046205 RepID=UPI0024BB9047|nr:hydroxyethylthiazole kinase [Cryobacterium sp. PH31-AA6]MDJ0324342.1 hydroxyethylthiazole kinase [Cryobacterium sp. PH31-AA6]